MTPANNERLYTLFFMVGVTFVFISMVSALYYLTRDTIQRNQELVEKRAILQAAGIEVPKNGKAAVAAYETHVRKAEGMDHYHIMKNEHPAGYVYYAQGPGVWGEIIMLLGLNPGRDRLTGIAVLKQNETPGLGARITEDWFVRQFIGKRPPLGRVEEGQPASETAFQAITGATNTSRAVQDIINQAVARAARHKEGM